MRLDDYKRGLSAGLAIGLGYLSVSFSFGINAVAGGLTILQGLIKSMTNVTSAGQVAGLESMLHLAPLVEMALVQLTINIRYSLMSISLSQKLDDSMTTAHRMAMAFCNTDEVFAVAIAASRDGLVGKNFLYGLITMPYLGWSLGTLLGAAAGSILPANLVSALGIMIYGMFLAIILPPVRGDKPIRFVVLAAALASVVLFYAPVFSGVSSGFQIIIAALLAAGVGAYLFPVEEAA